MRPRLLAVLVLALASCIVQDPPPATTTPASPPATTPPAPPPDPPPGPVGEHDAQCAEPRPAADWTCMQDCGPPVAREGDPPPPWRWLSPADAENRRKFGCPRCLPPTAAIATPGGDVAVSALVEGQLVWSRDERGQRVAVPVVRVASAPTPADHHLVMLELADGRTVVASAGHPLGDGRPLGAVLAGDLVDGSRVRARHLRPFGSARTYDLVPASSTRSYWADGVLLNTTLP
jgi:hypothetical protein